MTAKGLLPSEGLPREMSDAAAFGREVREARKRLGLKQSDAAGLLGVGVRFLSELERGKPTLELERVLRVVSGLGLQVFVVERRAKA